MSSASAGTPRSASARPPKSTSIGTPKSAPASTPRSASAGTPQGAPAGTPRSASVRPHVVIYTDGASRGNPGPGGYGAVIVYVGPDGVEHKRELSCGFRRTTNNRMELLAAIVALEELKRPCDVELHSDSQYVVNAFNKHWVESWQRKGWKTASKQPVKNPDLWQRLLAAMKSHNVIWLWVKGHAGHALNERCDELATTAADNHARHVEDAGFTG